MSGYPNCPICKCKIIENSKSCPTCHYPHHSDCWEVNDGCGVKECKPNSVVVKSSRYSDGSTSLTEYATLLVLFVMFSVLAISAIRSATGEIYGNVATGIQIPELNPNPISLEKNLSDNKDESVDLSDSDLGDIAYEKGDLVSAVESYSRAIKTDEVYLATDKNNLAYLYAEQASMLDKATELIGEALMVEPENPYFLDTEAWIFYKQGQFDKAGQSIERALNLAPNNKEISDHYVEIWLKIYSQEKDK